MFVTRKKRVIQTINEIISVFTPEELVSLRIKGAVPMDFRTLLINSLGDYWPRYSREKTREVAACWKSFVVKDIQQGKEVNFLLLELFRKYLFE